jgi:N-acyl-L-homoserine lactone synthetase
MPGAIEIYGVVLFYTSSAAIRAERILLKHGWQVKLIPTPREFSSDCGIALRFDWSRAEEARELLASAHIEISSLHKLQ